MALSLCRRAAGAKAAGNAAPSLAGLLPRQPRSLLPSRPTLWFPQLRMASKAAGGSTSNKKDNRRGKRLGVKVLGDQVVKKNQIIVRQRGCKYHPGKNVLMGRDHTLHAEIDGLVRFRRRLMTPKPSSRRWRTWINVDPFPEDWSPHNPNRERKKLEFLEKKYTPKKPLINRCFTLRSAK